MGRETKPVPDLQKDPTPGQGVRSLLQGNRSLPVEKAEPQATVAAPAPAPAPEPRIVIPPWYYFGLDLLLLAAAVGVAWPNPAGLSWKGQFVCGLLVVLGAGVAVAGVLKLRE